MKTKIPSMIIIAMLIFSGLIVKGERPAQKIQFFVDQGKALEQLIKPEKEMIEDTINNIFVRYMSKESAQDKVQPLGFDITEIIKPDEEVEEGSLAVVEDHAEPANRTTTTK